MGRKWYMRTNTKMFKGIAETERFVSRLCELTRDIPRDDFELFVIPSFVTLDRANAARDRKLLTLGAQNMCWEEKGQYTGEISPLMLLEAGCELVMIGHSERRHIFRETDDEERDKLACAVSHGLKALLCIGETEEEKAEGRSREALRRQLGIGLETAPRDRLDMVWIAYEPVWAIGVRGKPITLEYADEMLSFIRSELVRLLGEEGETVPVFYGGSVNPDNAEGLARLRDIDGLFVGRSAWDAEKFDSLIRKALRARES